jgi:dTDP-4-amino-4,6-dideoxygalactose transaminase
MLDRRWLTNAGPYVMEFERKLADAVGAPHVVAMTNATLALELVAEALGWRGEVILPSFTFIATAHALRRRGLQPVFCDVDARTHNLDPRKAEAAITPRTAAIVGVHVWGRPCAVEQLETIARRHHLGLVFDAAHALRWTFARQSATRGASRERPLRKARCSRRSQMGRYELTVKDHFDAAHALGCTSGGRPIGGFGDAEVFSFHATKVVNTFEGGAVATNSAELAERLIHLRNFGFDGEDHVAWLGTNAKMPEISAAMGLGGLESLSAWVDINRRNYHEYRAQLDGVAGIEILPYDEVERNNYQYVVVRVDPGAAGLTRDQLRAVLRAENALARRYFYPGCHRLEPYRSELQDHPPVLPVTERLTESVLALPTGTAVGRQEIEQMGRIVRLCMEHGIDIRRRLEAPGSR